MKFSYGKRGFLVNETSSSHGQLGNYKYRVIWFVCLCRVIYWVVSMCYTLLCPIMSP